MINRSLAVLLKPMVGIATANIAGQVVFILLSMVVTRLIAPSDMGVFGHFMTLVACASLVSSLGVESAIVSAPTKHESLMLTGGVFYISVVGSLVVVGGYAIFQSFLKMPAPLDGGMLVLAIITIVLANAYSAFQFFKARACDYKSLASGGFFNNSLRGVGQFAFAMTPLTGFHALVGGETVARALAIFSIASKKEVLLALRLPVRFSDILFKAAQRTIKQSMHFLSANVLEAFLFWMPVILFGHLYGLDVAGFVALVSRLFSGPVQIISRAAADVYHGQAQKLRNDTNQLKSLTYGLWAAIFALAALMPMAFWVLGDRGFAFVFGDKWGGVANVALGMSPLLATQLLAPIATRLSLVRNMVKIRLLYTFACLCVAAVFYVQGLQWFADAQTGITAYSLSIFVLCLVYLGYLARHFSIIQDVKP